MYRPPVPGVSAGLLCGSCLGEGAAERSWLAKVERGSRDHRHLPGKQRTGWDMRWPTFETLQGDDGRLRAPVGSVGASGRSDAGSA